jgi:hypothetical protein
MGNEGYLFDFRARLIIMRRFEGVGGGEGEGEG